MWKRCLALALAGAMLLACTACGKGAPGPFQFARRILTYYDLDYDSHGDLIVEPGEILVFFTYMESFDAVAAREVENSYTAWSAEAVDHAASLEYMGERLQKSAANDGRILFSGKVDFGIGLAVSETWMLPEREYRAAYTALLRAGWSAPAKDKAFWLVYNPGKGYYSESYDKAASFHIKSYLAESARPNAEAMHMSTELMRQYFPFLGRE